MGAITVERAADVTNTLIVNYPMGWTWDDYAQAVTRMVDLADGQRLNYINVYEMGAFMPLSGGNTVKAPNNLQVGFTVYVTQDHNIQRTLRHFQRMIGHREGVHFTFAPTVVAACRLLHLKGGAVQDLQPV